MLRVTFVQPSNEDGMLNYGSGLLYVYIHTHSDSEGQVRLADSLISNSSSEVKLEIPQRTYTQGTCENHREKGPGTQGFGHGTFMLQGASLAQHI